jgi:hypothetical protein
VDYHGGVVTSTDPGLEEARRHVKHVRDFNYHLMVFLFVGLILVIVDRAGGPNDAFAGLDWAHWVLIAWGMGVAGHAVYAFFGNHRAEQLYLRERGQRPGNR